MGFSEPWPGGKTPGHKADRLLRLLGTPAGDRARHHRRHGHGGPAALSFAAPPRCNASRGWCDELARVWDEETRGDPHPPSLPLEPGVLRRLPWVVFRRAEATFLPRGTRLRPPCVPTLGELPALRGARPHRAACAAATRARCHGCRRSTRAPLPGAGALGRAGQALPARPRRAPARGDRGRSSEVLPDGAHWMACSRDEVALRIGASRARRTPAPCDPARSRQGAHLTLFRRRRALGGAERSMRHRRERSPREVPWTPRPITPAQAPRHRDRTRRPPQRRLRQSGRGESMWRVNVSQISSRSHVHKVQSR